MFGEKEECLESCVELGECFACNETYEENIQNCPCTKNCPSEYFIKIYLDAEPIENFQIF